MTQTDVTGKGNITVSPAENLPPEEDDELGSDIQPPKEVNEQNHPEKSDGQADYKTKYAESFKEAMRLTRELEKSKSEKAYQKNLIAVAKDVSQIHEIAKEDQKTADRICQEYWGKNYSEAVKEAGGEERAAETDYETAARKVFREEKEREEQKQIEDFEIQYFIDNGIEVGSEKFKKIMSEYHSYQPKTISQAKKLMEMTHNFLYRKQDVELPSAPASFGSKGAMQPSEFTEEDRKLMQKKGWDAKKMQAFKSSGLY